MSGLIDFSVRDGVAVLRLNRPDKLNTLTPAMAIEIIHQLDAWAQDENVRCLLLTGTGRAFCAGFDLKDAAFDGGNTPQHADPDLSEAGMMRRIWNFPRARVVALNGVAAGGGVGLALCGDFVIAGRSAAIVSTLVTKLGAVPDLGATWLISRLLGRARALGVALLGQKISAETAANWGLVWECVDDDKLMDRAMELAAQLRDTSAVGLAETRRLIDGAFISTYVDQMHEELRVGKEIAKSPAFAEAILAFREGRKPVFN